MALIGHPREAAIIGGSLLGAFIRDHMSGKAGPESVKLLDTLTEHVRKSWPQFDGVWGRDEYSDGELP